MSVKNYYPLGKESGRLLDEGFLTKRKIQFLGSKSRVWHSYVELIFLDQILTRYHFDIVIELGTGNGGITNLFAIHCLRTSAKLYAFDIRGEPLRGLYKKLKPIIPIKFHKLDVLSEEGEKIISNLFGQGRVLLYCDNGNKIEEVKRFAPYLKEDDVIMAHDKDQEIFLRDIITSIKDNQLRPFHESLAKRLGAGIFSYVRCDIP